MARRGNGAGHGWGKGTGWGGPARGPGSGAAKAAPFTAGNLAAAGGHNLSRSMKRQALLDGLFDLAFTAERQEVQVSACVAWLNRVEGKPVAMTTAHVSAADLSTLNDADLERELRLYAAHFQGKIEIRIAAKLRKGLQAPARASIHTQ